MTDWLADYEAAWRRFEVAAEAHDRLEAELALSDCKQAVADGQAERFVRDVEAMGGES